MQRHASSKEELSKKLMEQQRMAERRRLALHELQKERLARGHLLVTERLRASRQREDLAEMNGHPGLDDGGHAGRSGGSKTTQRRLEARLAHAEAARAQLVASRAARAGAHAAHARGLGAMLRVRRELEAGARRERLEERLRLAEERRQQLARSPRSPSGSVARYAFRSGIKDDVPGSKLTQTKRSDTEQDHLPDFASGSKIKQPEQSSREPAEEDTGPQLLLRVDQFRRQVSSRKLQQAWRAFTGKNLTTRTLALALVATGVTGVELPDVTGVELPDVDPPPPAGSAAGMRPERATSIVLPPVTTAAMAYVGGMGPRAPDPSRPVDEFDVFANAMSSPATLKAAQVT